MNLKRSQTYIDFSVKNWEHTSFSNTLRGMCEAAKEYENDEVEVHQVVDLGIRKGEWHYLIILNITQDLDNLGKSLDETN